MQSKKHSLSLFVIFLLAVQLACGLFPPQNTDTDTAATLNALYTAAAQTLEAGAPPGALTATPGLPLPTATSIPAYVTATSLSNQGSAPAVRCDAASFVEDVSIDDGTVVGRGASFTKVWRLKNVGTCSWTPSYALVFVSGDLLSGPSVVALTGNVNPGQTVDLAVNLKAPDKDGHYRGYWKLRNAAGVLFGIGNDGVTAFWVDINVKGPSFLAYDFAANFCNADWENNNRSLPCPGSEDDPKGYVIKLNTPRMENGSKEDEAGLLTVPKMVTNGFISGTYPAFKVQNGDRFRALISCQYRANKCNVIFKLEYRVDGAVKTLGSWQEVNEGKFYSVDVDLSALKDKNVKFILTVLSNGSPADDEAIWVAPRIIRSGVQPTATSTATFTPTATSTSTSTATATPAPTETPTETPTP